MAGIDDILFNEMGLLFIISTVVWGLIFLYMFYTNNKLKNLERELNSLREE
ncbi:MAG: CcmD family protein [Candidatus Odinarchaeota archaeon]